VPSHAVPASADEAPARVMFEAGQSAGGGASVRFDYLGASTYVAKGWSAISTGAYEEAERALRRALELAPDDREAGALLGWALMGQDRLGEALTPLHDVLAADADYPLARVSVGYVHYRQGRYGEAIEDLAAVARGADDRKAVLYAHYWLGLVYQRREMHEDALGYFRQALALGPNLLQAYYEMGRVLWRTGDRAAALDAWRAGAAANKFNAWGKRCEELRVLVEQGGEPPPLD
jgi:tetratricopeptide (TPR) repeat protein